MANRAKRNYRWAKFGEMLTACLAKAGLQEKFVASELGYSPALISGWITGRGKPNPQQMEKLTTLLSKHGVPADTFGWLHALFIGEYFRCLGTEKRDRTLLWNLLNAGTRKLAGNHLVEGFHQVRALASFANDHQLLDGQGAVAWQDSLTVPEQLQCFWVVTLDFRDNDEFFNVARKHIAAGAKYVYFIRDKYLATPEEKQRGIKREFNQYVSRLIESGLDLTLVSELVMPVAFHDNEHILALDFIVANPHTRNPVGFQSFIRVKPNIIYNIELPVEIAVDRVDQVIKYLAQRDNVSEDAVKAKLFPQKPKNGIPKGLRHFAAETPDKIEENHLPIVMAAWNKAWRIYKLGLTPSKEEVSLTSNQLAQIVSCKKERVIVLIEEIDRYQKKSGWELLVIKQDAKTNGYKISFSIKAIGYPCTADFMFHLTNPIERSKAVRDAVSHYYKTFPTSLEWALQTGYLVPHSAKTMLFEETHRFHAEKLFLGVIKEEYDAKSCGDDGHKPFTDEASNSNYQKRSK